LSSSHLIVRLNKGYFETDTVAATFREFISDYENKVRRIDTALDLMAADNYQEPASNIFLQANPNISPGEEQLRRQDPSLIDRYFNYYQNYYLN